MPSQRRYPRMARVNELVHEILADELELLDDDRLVLVTVMNVVVESDLRHALLVFDTPEGAERDADVLAALEEHRARLQAAIGRQAKLKRTPQLTFAPDEAERGAARVDDVLRHLDG